MMKMDKKVTPDLADKIVIREAKSEVNDLTKQVKLLKKRLNIPDEQARSIKEQFDNTYDSARDGISLIGGSDDIFGRKRNIE